MNRWVTGGVLLVAGGFLAARRRSRAPDTGISTAPTLGQEALPRGPLGWLTAQGMAIGHRPYYRMMARLLALQPEDELLEVGCGSAGLLKHQAAHVRHVAGLDLSTIQVGMARRRLADRLAAGTAEIVLGDAASLPWGDDRFSVVTSTWCLEFCPDPQRVLREMHRVLRPGGRAVFTYGLRAGDAQASGTRGDLGAWRWSEAAARRMAEEAGFDDVTLAVFPDIVTADVSNLSAGEALAFELADRVIGNFRTWLIRGTKSSPVSRTRPHPLHAAAPSSETHAAVPR